MHLSQKNGQKYKISDYAINYSISLPIEQYILSISNGYNTYLYIIYSRQYHPTSQNYSLTPPKRYQPQYSRPHNQ